MSIYVMSDIHGQYDTFKRLLEQIEFSNDDKLYILGDVIDRGKNNLKILDYIMEHKNIEMILGNHETMMLEYYKTKCHIDLTLWKKNGGSTTFFEMELISEEKREEYINYLKTLKPCKIIEVNNEEYLLVHAGIHPDTTEEEIEEMIEKDNYYLDDDLLWIRYGFLMFKNKLPFTIIFGHTPIVNYPNYIRGMNDEMIETIKQSKITKWHNKIGIDCGCAGKIQLGCLRLDDMEEFYEKCN